MPDAYWNKIGEQIEAKKKDGWVVCPDCGEFKRVDGSCGHCAQAKCMRCGAVFDNNKKDSKGRGRKLCPDCVGDRSGDKPPLPGERLGGGMTTPE